MIERKFVNQNVKEFEIKEYIRTNLSRVGLSDVKLQRTPLGEKIIISTSRPGLVVGRSGTNITKLTQDLKQVFKLENPQIEIEEVLSIGLDVNIMAEMIANSLEKFGMARFKGIGHKAMADIMGSGAVGVEILISGKVPSARAKSWRFYQGYLKKCGDVAVSEVKVAYAAAQLKSGTVGIKVSIMLPGTILPDRLSLKEEEIVAPGQVEEVKDGNVKKEIEQKIKELEPRGGEDKDEAGKKKQETKQPRKSAQKKTAPKPKEAKRKNPASQDIAQESAQESESAEEASEPEPASEAEAEVQDEI